MEYHITTGYLSTEISKITNANEVFEALSRGYLKYSDILPSHMFQVAQHWLTY